MGYAAGQLVVMQSPRPSLGLAKGDAGVVRTTKGLTTEVEFLFAGKPSRVVTVPSEALTLATKARDPIAEGREAAQVRQLLASLIGSFETIEEAEKLSGDARFALDVSANLVKLFGCDVGVVYEAASKLLGKVSTLTDEVLSLTQARATHHFTIIGPSNLKRVYVDIGRDDAVHRYLIEHERAEIGDVPVSELDIGESFSATAVGPD